jgi:hypothetical protein
MFSRASAVARARFASVVARVLPRHASSSSSPPAPPASDALKEKIRSAAAALGRDVAAGGEQLVTAFGSAHPEGVFVSEYYLHKLDHLLLPSLAAFMRAPEEARGASAVKTAAFFSGALRALPDARLTHFVGSAAMLPGVDLPLLLCVVRGVGTPHAGALFTRLTASLPQLGDPALEALAEGLARVPVAPPPTWPFPHLAPGLERAGATDAWRPPPGAPPAPFELHPAAAHLRDSVDGAAWLFFSANAVLEANVAHFYATGDAAALDRVVEAALPWADAGAALPNAVELVANLAAPLPPALQLREGAPPGEALAAIRANVARLALWLLLHHSRRHPAVVAAVARACGALGGAVAEPDAASAAARAAGAPPPPLSAVAADDALRGVKVLPALLHLIATSRLNNPHQLLKGRLSLDDLRAE